MSQSTKARAKRIDVWHRTGRVFQSTPDLSWLFVELALANGGELHWLDKDQLTDLVRLPIEEALDGSSVNKLLEQAAIFIENPKFHCTALRDFFVLRLVSALVRAIREGEPKSKRLFWRWWLAGLVIAVALFSYRRWLGGTVVVLYFLFALTIKSVSDEQIPYGAIPYRTRHVMLAALAGAENAIRLGGYDEPEMMKMLNQTVEAGAPIPSILFALLRLPRRNVEHEVSGAFRALDSEKRELVSHEWSALLNFMLENDDGEASKKLGEVEAEKYAKAFGPIRTALDELSIQFANDDGVRFRCNVREGYGIDYEIDTEFDGARHYLSLGCMILGDTHFYPMGIRVPDTETIRLSFSTGQESEAIGVIRASLDRYRENRSLGTSGVEAILADYKANRVWS